MESPNSYIRKIIRSSRNQVLSAPTTLTTQDYESLLNKIDQQPSFSNVKPVKRARPKKKRQWSERKKKSSQERVDRSSALEAETMQMEMRLKILSDLKTKTKREIRHQRRHRKQEGSLWASAKPLKGHDYIGKVLKTNRKENKLLFGKRLYDPCKPKKTGKEKPMRNRPGREKIIKLMSECTLEINNAHVLPKKALLLKSSSPSVEVKDCETIRTKTTTIDVEEDEKSAHNWEAVENIEEKQDDKTAHKWEAVEHINEKQKDKTAHKFEATEHINEKPDKKAGCLWGSREASPEPGPRGCLWGSSTTANSIKPDSGIAKVSTSTTPESGTRGGLLWGSKPGDSQGSLWMSHQVRPASTMNSQDLNIFATRVHESGACDPWWLREKKTESKRKVCYECFAWFCESESFEGNGKLYCSESCRDKSLEKLTAPCAFSGCEKRVPRTERKLRWKNHFFCSREHVVFL